MKLIEKARNKMFCTTVIKPAQCGEIEMGITFPVLQQHCLIIAEMIQKACNLSKLWTNKERNFPSLFFPQAPR